MKNNNIIRPNFQKKKDEMLDVRDWQWTDFKLMWETIRADTDEDHAWKMITVAWMIRAGEEVPPELATLENSPNGEDAP